ncbi:hypothetical protein D9758_015421 [Tetrapyrgos nigripes]|uniref:Uncharacterized protein n=1 Tax=Tetrapyrgos nigripes TaxID=182062 RepID=A0A8H5CKX9_9AGAR|nr:hypothetical protein D9758_015421 [Tetrapyrgos nigripes]
MGRRREFEGGRAGRESVHTSNAVLHLMKLFNYSKWTIEGNYALVRLAKYFSAKINWGIRTRGETPTCPRADSVIPTVQSNVCRNPSSTVSPSLSQATDRASISLPFTSTSSHRLSHWCIPLLRLCRRSTVSARTTVDSRCPL